MQTDDLIQRLAADLAPVRPLRPPGLRASVWLFAAVLYLAALAFARPGFSLALEGADAGFLMVQSVGVIAGIMAAIAAFASVVPGHSSRTYIWPLLATGIWLAMMIISSFGVRESQAIVTAHHEWLCVAVVVIGGAPLVAALTLMLRRGAPLNPVRTALLGALAAGLLANFSACISRSHAADAITLVWHGSAVLALAAVCIVGARFVLRWTS